MAAPLFMHLLLKYKFKMENYLPVQFWVQPKLLLIGIKNMTDVVVVNALWDIFEFNPQ